MGELIKIRELSLKYGVSARALKYYEEMGLITSTRNSDYAYRLYNEEAEQRLQQILILRKLNISIKDIQLIFNTAGSEVVLEVLGKKVDAIDEEVSLLHELKEIILDFIRQIEQSDFGKESDIKLLYEKAKEVEAKLAMTPEIIKKHSYCYLIFNLKDKNDVIEACNLYCEAFGAKKTSEEALQGDWIGINIKLFNFGIFVQSADMPNNRGGCCISFSTEQDLRKAYDLLSKEAEESSLHLDWHWTPLAATVKDKFGVTWLFCI